MSVLPIELAPDYEALARAYELHLFASGVLLPQKDTQQAVMLIFLYRNMGSLVHLEDLRAFVRAQWSGRSQDLQPRHLKYAGWHILLSGKSNDRLKMDVKFDDHHYSPPKTVVRKAGDKLPNGYLMLVTVADASPDFKAKKRRGDIDRTSWDSIKLSYNNKFALCKEMKNLEQGHMDPTKELTADNLIPMCSECNNWASSDLIFDKAGRIIALASPRFVEKSDLMVKLQILDRLKKDKSVMKGAARDSKKG